MMNNKRRKPSCRPGQRGFLPLRQKLYLIYRNVFTGQRSLNELSGTMNVFGTKISTLIQRLRLLSLFVTRL